MNIFSRFVFSFLFKWIKLFLLLLPLFYIVYGLFLSRIKTKVFDERFEIGHHEKFYDYSGVTNVHTQLSSGTGSLRDVLEAAQKENLNFLFLTDLNALRHQEEKEEYNDRLLVFVDGEYSYLNVHLLNYDGKWPGPFQTLAHSQSLFTDYLTRRFKEDHMGIFVLAHPFKKDYEWTGEYPPGLDGVEVINLTSLWQNIWNEQKGSLFKALLTYPFHSQLAFIHLITLPEKEFQLWDRLNEKKHTIAFAGSDAKGRIKFYYLNIRFPSYEKIFSLLKTHLLLTTELTGNPQKDRKKITRAIRKGQFFISFDFLENPKGFAAYVQKKKRLYPIGSQIPWEPSLKLFIDLPDTPLVSFKTLIYKNGSTHQTFYNQTKVSLFPLSPGVYRIVLFLEFQIGLFGKKKWIPWIITNPFYID